MPSRETVMCPDYRQACEIALRTSHPPRKISKQAFNLFPKIREVDRLMSPAVQETVREVHPEVAFWALNGERALETPKKVKSRANPEGLEQRKGLLAGAGFGTAFLETRQWPARSCGPDDWLDACANAWSAWRIVSGRASCFPERPEKDVRGLRMEILG
jgi:predicted RNase H-like nuclease